MDVEAPGGGVVVKDAFLRIEGSCFDNATKFDVDPSKGPVISLANCFANGITGKVLPDEVAAGQEKAGPGTKVISLGDTQLQATPDPNAKRISVTLTHPQQEDGISLIESNGESENTPVTAAGRPGWKAVRKNPGGGRMVYFSVMHPSFRDGGHPDVAITLDYLDEGDCSADLVYDSSDQTVRVVESAPGAWKTAGVVKFGSTGEWKQQTFVVHDALFSGRCNGCDLRLNVGKDVDVTLGGLSIAVADK
jgi:hypothetical protein